MNLENFTSYVLYYSTKYTGDKFEKVATEELGFIISRNFRTFILSVPDFEKGNKRTPAQAKLYTFEKELSKARKERKTKLLVECDIVKNAIYEGKFDYIICSTNTIIKVHSTFFSKLNLTFKFSESSFWNFTL